MGIALDPTREHSRHQELIRAGKGSLSNGLDLTLTSDEMSRVLYEKLESHNPDISDTDHGEMWEEEFISHAKLKIPGLDGQPRSLSADDGIIVRTVGRPDGHVFIDMANMRFLNDEEAERELEVFGREYPRFVRYLFRLDRVIITDGPQQNAALQLNEEQKVQSQKTELISAITEAFAEVGRQMKEAGQIAPAPALVQAALEKTEATTLTPKEEAARKRLADAKRLKDELAAETAAQDKELATGAADVVGAGQVETASAEEVGAR